MDFGCVQIVCSVASRVREDIGLAAPATNDVKLIPLWLSSGLGVIVVVCSLAPPNHGVVPTHT